MREIMRLDNKVSALVSVNDEKKLNEIFNNLEEFGNFYSDRLVLEFMSELYLLEEECSKKINDFYSEAKILSNVLQKKVKTKDSTQILQAWVSYCPQTYTIGLKAMICLYENVIKNNQKTEELKKILENHLNQIKA